VRENLVAPVVPAVMGTTRAFVPVPHRSPEDDLLLHVQGMSAEYERATIIARHRRGQRHAAPVGAVHVWSGAPYGYR
jgi:hypothetical protein